MLISHKHKFITIDIPKTGTRSRRYILNKLGVVDIIGNPANSNEFFRQHSSILDVEQGFTKNEWVGFNEYYKYSVVRNPWDRYFSLFRYSKAIADEHSESTKYPNEGAKRQGERSANLFRGRLYTDVLKTLIQNHTPHSYFLLNENNDCEFNKISLFEDLSSGFSEFCLDVGIDPPPPLIQSNKSSIAITREDIYTQELVDMVAEKEKWVIEKFNYDYSHSINNNSIDRKKLPKKKIYTYYEEINFNKQPDLINVWKESWSSAGYEPVVLGYDDALKHPYYKEYVSYLKDMHIKVTDVPISDYGLACYVRWLAYATVPDTEAFFVCDYDVICNGFSDLPVPGQLHLMDHCCPCFVSGTSKQFEELCHMFVDISLSNMEEIKSHPMQCYHDQEFFLYNEHLLRERDVVITRDRDKVGDFYDPKSDNKCKAIHFAHTNIDNIAKDNNMINIDLDRYRVDLIRKFLKI